MLKAMVGLQWSRVRAVVVLGAVVMFSLPLMILRVGGGPEGGGVGQVGEWLRNAEVVGRVIPMACLVIAAYLGGAAWADDARGGHVYALSLPVSRERFVVYRFLASGLPILVPVAGLLAGALIATLAVRLPTGVQAYPVALAVRALFSTIVGFALVFALAIATRRALVMILGVLAGLVALELVLGLLDVEFSLLETLFRLLVVPPGPLSILAGHWALFDV